MTVSVESRPYVLTFSRSSAGKYSENYHSLRDMEKLQIVFQLPGGEAMKLKATMIDASVRFLLNHTIEFDFVTFSGETFKLGGKTKLKFEPKRDVSFDFANEISVESSMFEILKMVVEVKRSAERPDYKTDVKV